MTRKVAEVLTSAFLRAWSQRSVDVRGRFALGEEERAQWLSKLRREAVAQYFAAPNGDWSEISDFILAPETFAEASRSGVVQRRPVRWFAFHPQMRAPKWDVPRLDTVGDVASWLEVTTDQLRFFADTSGVERTRRHEHARNYTHQWIERGEKLPRLLEAPKSWLKSLQRKVLHELLEKVPVHDAAHGFVHGRSALTHAKLHVGRRVVVRFDLRHFFTSINTSRAFGVLRQLRYTHQVSAVLLGLCTTRTPNHVLKRAPMPDLAEGDVINDRFVMLRKLEAWHFPQGAPTSPAWANLCAWNIDARLSKWASGAGLNYSRYADDLVFSGDQLSSIERLSYVVDDVVRDEGFLINRAKTKVMHAQQRQFVTGVVVNERPNVTRAEFDQLKALLHRCEMKGALSQSKGPVDQFRAELVGRVAWVDQLNPTRGAKLKASLARIDWSE